MWGRIDIWWRGQKNGSLMLLLAHLLRTNWEWTGAQIRLLRVVENEAGREPAEAALRRLASEARLEVVPHVIVGEKPFADVLRETSYNATCVFLGFELPDVKTQTQWYGAYDKMLGGLPTTILVSSRGGEDVKA